MYQLRTISFKFEKLMIFFNFLHLASTLQQFEKTDLLFTFNSVKKNGAERDVFHYEQAWEKAMYPDMMAEYMLAGNEMFGPIKSVAIRKTYQPKKKLSKTQKEGGKIANDTLSESILKGVVIVIFGISEASYGQTNADWTFSKHTLGRSIFHLAIPSDSLVPLPRTIWLTAI